jgi:HlyD family secretion protein
MKLVVDRGTLLEPFPASQTLQGRSDPSPDIRLGLIVAALFFVLFLGWAAVAPLGAATAASGRLAVSGSRQTVQHQEGGVVSEVLVREGDHVRRGQLMIRLAGEEARALERGLSSQAIGLLAQQARLRAEQAGQSTITLPAQFATLEPAERAIADQAMHTQEAQMAARRSLLAAQRGIIHERTAEAGSAAGGFHSQVAGASEQIRLIDEELDGLRSVGRQGFVSQNRIRATERERARLVAQRGEYAAGAGQSAGRGAETRLQVLEAQSGYLDKIATELREVETSLNDCLPKLQAARDQLARIDIRATTDGTIIGLSVFHQGAVVAPGQKLMDIVPNRSSLVVEAKVAVSDGDDISVGQQAFVRFDTLHERSLPALKGKISRVSADAFTDEKSGASFYTAEVLVPPSEMKRIDQLAVRHSLRAGMPVSVQVPGRSRTALQFALEPLLGSLRGTSSE